MGKKFVTLCMLKNKHCSGEYPLAKSKYILKSTRNKKTTGTI